MKPLVFQIMFKSASTNAVPYKESSSIQSSVSISSRKFFSFLSPMALFLSLMKSQLSRIILTLIRVCVDLQFPFNLIFVYLQFIFFHILSNQFLSYFSDSIFFLICFMEIFDELANTFSKKSSPSNLSAKRISTCLIFQQYCVSIEQFFCKTRYKIGELLERSLPMLLISSTRLVISNSLQSINICRSKSLIAIVSS